MPVCPHCGKESRSSDRFCKHCGRLMDVVVEGSAGPLPLHAAAQQPLSGSANQTGAPGGQPARAAGNGTMLSGGPAGSPTRQGPVVARLILQARAGSGQAPQELAMEGRDVTIGRAPGCDVVLPDDPLASRRHSMLRYDGQRYSVADLGSSNGTYVNDVEIHEVTPLHSGDRITVGEHEFLYLIETASGLAGRPSPEQFNTDGFAIRVPPSFSTAAPLLSAQPVEMGPAIHASEPSGAPATDNEPAASPATPTVKAPAISAAGAIQQGATNAPAAPADVVARDIEDLRARLLEVSAALARRSEGAEQGARQLREVLVEVRTRVEQALAVPAAAEEAHASSDAAKLDTLLGVVRAAAENPRHLDHVTALAGHADELAEILEAQQRRMTALETARREVAAVLEELRTRLAGMMDEKD